MIEIYSEIIIIIIIIIVGRGGEAPHPSRPEEWLGPIHYQARPNLAKVLYHC